MSKQPSSPMGGQLPSYTIGDVGNHTAAPTAAPSHPLARPHPSQIMNPDTAFLEAYECAKLNRTWEKVSGALLAHADWLTRIPDGRSWTMLHQIVFSGDVIHLNEVLALQAGNPQFRLLFQARDGKTVRDVATERSQLYPNMLRRIERLVAVDELLNNAKERKWELVKQCITAQPDIVNEKPPYRRYYLAHHLAYVGQLDKFKELSTICHFKLDLLAEGKTISQIAREHNKIPFAEYVEHLQPESNDTTEGTTASAAASSSHSASGGSYYGTSYNDDLCISFIPAHVATSLTNDHYFVTHTLYQGGYPTSIAAPAPATTNHYHHQNNHNDKKPAKSKATASSATTEEEDNAYEQTVINNVAHMSEKNLLNSITCCITKAILRDPVVAADGFTYEREAITKWFETSNRSPMTNQELEDLELKPNFAIKSILQALQGANSLPAKSNKK
ncbi:unnamed protein product [Rotaria socialis]|uniref:U-box domain-containing protein n=2 Tax=Rotaria socialis TaxID=392032 RepID=A0A818TP83_9BILA|nr:unnamed protein product [Rotaria socialis]